MTEKTIPEAFLPGEYISEELEERGWSQVDLSDILDLSPTIISDIITGKRIISLKFAQALAGAFGTSAEVWLKLQNAYGLASSSSREDVIARRAKLYEKAPIREMIRRGWIEKTSNVDVLETQVCKFLGTSKIGDEVEFAHAARKSDNYYTKPNPIQTAWLMRAKMLAPEAPVERQYVDHNFNSMMKELAPLRLEPEGISQVPKIFSKYGIRFLIIEYLPQAKIDGTCFWLNSSPVIALSMRFDRIDYFWHTLIHDLCHVKYHEGKVRPLLETLVVGEDAQPFEEKPQAEKRADNFAVKFLVNQAELRKFITRNRRPYSTKSIKGFSKRNGVHAGIVVGQLHHRGELPWSYFRGMLVKVREFMTDKALTDGWGKIASITS